MSNALATAMRVPVRLPNLEPSILTTPVFRASFVHLDVPWGGDEGKGTLPSYQLLAVFADDADLSQMKAAQSRGLVSKFGPEAPGMVQHGVYKVAIMPKAKMAIKYQGFEGNGFYASLRSRSTNPPVCINLMSGNPVVLQRGAIERVIYAGCYCYATFQPYTYDKSGGKGISFGLRTLVKVADGDSLGGPTPASREEVLGSVAGLNLPGLIISNDVPTLIEGKAETPPWEGDDTASPELEDVEQF